MKSILVFVSLLLIQGMAQGVAQTQTIPESLTNCSTETNNLKRLVCYDDIVEKIKKQAIVADKMKAPESMDEMSAPPTSSPSLTKKAALSETLSTNSEIEPKSDTIAQFGMEHKIAQENAEDKIYALTSSITKGPFGKLSIGLDNGQIWKQIDSGKIRLKVGDRLYVERGALNSFFLSTDDISRRVRVKRIK